MSIVSVLFIKYSLEYYLITFKCMRSILYLCTRNQFWSLLCACATSSVLFVFERLLLVDYFLAHAQYYIACGQSLNLFTSHSQPGIVYFKNTTNLISQYVFYSPTYTYIGPDWRHNPGKICTQLNYCWRISVQLKGLSHKN